MKNKTPHTGFSAVWAEQHFLHLINCVETMKLYAYKTKDKRMQSLLESTLGGWYDWKGSYTKRVEAFKKYMAEQEEVDKCLKERMTDLDVSGV